MYCSIREISILIEQFARRQSLIDHCGHVREKVKMETIFMYIVVLLLSTTLICLALV